LERRYDSIGERTLAEEGSLCDGLLKDEGEGGEEAGVVIRDDLFSDIAVNAKRGRAKDVSTSRTTADGGQSTHPMN
jgi:hypothetical protein